MIKLYPEYKYSGVERIGEIPAEWNISKLKYSDNTIMGQSPKSEDYAEDQNAKPFLQGNAEFGRLNPTPKIWCETANKEALEKDILISVRAPIGAINIADQNYGIGRGLAAVRGKKHSYKYLYYYLSSLNGYLNSLGTGSTFSAISTSDLKEIDIPIIPKDQEIQIAEYLDHKTGLIDAIIEKKQLLIEKLKEQRQAIINEAVTKGLNENAPMKDSGVEWIGNIPQHWRVKKIRYLSAVKRGASPRPIADPKYFSDKGEFGWVRIADVSASERYLENTTDQLSELGASLSVKQFPGDFFLSIAGTVGKPIITKIKCCIHDGFVWFPELKINPEYLYYLFSNKSPFQGLGKLGTQLNLNTDTIGNIKIPVMEQKEMEEIVDYLDNSCKKLDTTIEINLLLIEKLNHYRQAIISEAVTGKIDVREWEPQAEETV